MSRSSGPIKKQIPCFFSFCSILKLFLRESFWVTSSFLFCFVLLGFLTLEPFNFIFFVVVVVLGGLFEKKVNIKLCGQEGREAMGEGGGGERM